MRAMLLDAPAKPLRRAEIADPLPARGEILVRVRACGVCRTDLHIAAGELREAKLPLVLGHEIVGVVEQGGVRYSAGARVGIPWLGWTCGTCEFCTRGRENLCERARFTGYDFDGGYAELVAADERYCFPLPDRYGDVEAAPLLCAGLIGYRALRMTGDARRIGLYGFGAAAHLLAQVARHEGREIFAFTSPGDEEAQAFARQLGAVWAGSSLEPPPIVLDAAIVFAPVGALVPLALRAVRKGGTVVCGGIHMSDVPSFPYELLWGERVLRSVANLTREDAEDFLEIAGYVPLQTTVKAHPLAEANQVLGELRAGRIVGAAALVP